MTVLQWEGLHDKVTKHETRLVTGLDYIARRWKDGNWTQTAGTAQTACDLPLTSRNEWRFRRSEAGCRLGFEEVGDRAQVRVEW